MPSLGITNHDRVEPGDETIMLNNGAPIQLGKVDAQAVTATLKLLSVHLNHGRLFENTLAGV
jgi:hypothetical protein